MILKRIDSHPCVLIVDDSTPQKRAAVVCSASLVTPEIVNFITKHCFGQFFVAVSRTIADGFLLDDMSEIPHEGVPHMLVSVEAREGITTGISAFDRATTINILGETPDPKRLVRPGHIFPVLVTEGGSLVKPTLYEGGFDLVKLLGGSSALVVELLHENIESLNLPCVTLSEIISYRLHHEKIIVPEGIASLPTEFSEDFNAHIFKSSLDGSEHIALVKGTITSEPIMCRVQSEFTIADLIDNVELSTRELIKKSLSCLSKEKNGVFIYLRRNVSKGLNEQIAQWRSSYDKQPAASLREFGVGAQILKCLGITSIHLLSRSKKTVSGLSLFGIDIVGYTELT